MHIEEIPEDITKEFNILTNSTLKDKYIASTEDSFIPLHDGFTIIDKSHLTENTELTPKSLSKFITNFTLYIFTDDTNDELFKYDIAINLPIPISFYNYIENSKSILINFEAGKNIFPVNYYENNVLEAYTFFDSIVRGKLKDLTNSSYVDMYKLFVHLMEENEVKGIMSIAYETFISELSYSAKDKSKKYRLVAKGNGPAEDYIMVNIRDLPKKVSGLNALSSENIKQSVIHNMISSDENKRLTPLEQIAFNKL